MIDSFGTVFSLEQFPELCIFCINVMPFSRTKKKEEKKSNMIV